LQTLAGPGFYFALNILDIDSFIGIRSEILVYLSSSLGVVIVYLAELGFDKDQTSIFFQSATRTFALHNYNHNASTNQPKKRHRAPG
jgi:tryptophanyl-tRNA synthetase